MNSGAPVLSDKPLDPNFGEPRPEDYPELAKAFLAWRHRDIPLMIETCLAAIGINQPIATRLPNSYGWSFGNDSAAIYVIFSELRHELTIESPVLRLPHTKRIAMMRTLLEMNAHVLGLTRFCLRGDVILLRFVERVDNLSPPMLASVMREVAVLADRYDDMLSIAFDATMLGPEAEKRHYDFSILGVPQKLPNLAQQAAEATRRLHIQHHNPPSAQTQSTSQGLPHPFIPHDPSIVYHGATLSPQPSQATSSHHTPSQPVSSSPTPATSPQTQPASLATSAPPSTLAEALASSPPSGAWVRSPSPSRPTAPSSRPGAVRSKPSQPAPVPSRSTAPPSRASRPSRSSLASSRQARSSDAQPTAAPSRSSRRVHASATSSNRVTGRDGLDETSRPVTRAPSRPMPSSRSSQPAAASSRPTAVVPSSASRPSRSSLAS
ncbi:MAG: hypothetical protein AAFS10_24210, partial [Myxococcota bacterium]